MRYHGVVERANLIGYIRFEFSYMHGAVASLTLSDKLSTQMYRWHHADRKPSSDQRRVRANSGVVIRLAHRTLEVHCHIRGNSDQQRSSCTQVSGEVTLWLHFAASKTPKAVADWLWARRCHIRDHPSLLPLSRFLPPCVARLHDNFV